MGWSDKGLVVVDKPAEKEKDSAVRRLARRVLAAFGPGDQVVYSPDFGPETTFYRWRKQAVKDGILVYHRGAYFVAQKIKVEIN